MDLLLICRNALSVLYIYSPRVVLGWHAKGRTTLPRGCVISAGALQKIILDFVRMAFDDNTYMRLLRAKNYLYVLGESTCFVLFFWLSQLSKLAFLQLHLCAAVSYQEK